MGHGLAEPLDAHAHPCHVRTAPQGAAAALRARGVPVGAICGRQVEEAQTQVGRVVVTPVVLVERAIEEPLEPGRRLAGSGSAGLAGPAGLA